MEHTFHEKRRKQGFTLMELLSVVLIIGILAAIAIPNVLSLSKRLQIAKLDEFARQIYLAAQNETVKMKASGRLNAFYIEVEETHKGDWSLESIDREPSDYPEGDTTWKLLYYIPFDDPMVHKYFMQAESSLNIATEKGGSFIMELNPLTGDVYSVFYAEREDLKYHETWELKSRERKDREAAKIGYYCGTAGNSAVVLPGRFTPKVELTNGEELRAEITCPGMLQINGTQRKLNLLVTITDESGRVWKKEYSGGSNELNIVGDTARVELLLDSTEEEKGFANLTGKQLTPGDDITVKAEFTYTNGDIVITGDHEETVNSLFAYRKMDGADCVEIGVGCVRHLNNLRESKYVHGSGKKANIIQMKDIAFDSPEVKLDSFTPISNEALFERSSGTYDGGNNILSGFIIEDSSASSMGSGLFLRIKEFDMRNIRLVDCIIKGNSLVGTLAGTVESSAITNCGVYLTTKDDYGRHNDMQQRIEKYKVVGTGSTIGGLIGSAVDSELLNCFAAVSVSGAGNVGGLAGYQNGGKIVDCYSSGDVEAYEGGGGLVGGSESCVVSGCYSTSDVTAMNNSGGLLGKAMGTVVESSNSYGLVQAAEGAINIENLGGFIGNLSGGNTFSTCSYLRQAKYNDGYGDAAMGIEAKLFQELKSGIVNAVENSDPYDSKLARNVFPFPLITYSDSTGSVIRHYGDWPEELKLQTSLVYYEKYVEDGEITYGYYAETSLTMSGGEGEQEPGDVNTWKVDTLQDRVCVEDGYAIITPYALTSFEYKLNADMDENVKASPVLIGDSVENAYQMGKDVTLEFKRKGEKEGDQESTYTVSDCFIYRLPFQLQMTDRQRAIRFYDQLSLTGYVKDNVVFENYTFYYCPDFAKNAINPSLSDKDSKLPNDPDSRKKQYVYVRSARQLNALGRNEYYWNKTRADISGEHNKDREFGFKQETDIDFGKYETEYCGVGFNLMDTKPANIYRNRPIGRPNDTSGQTITATNNFRYVYDGGGHKIIDYCCYSDKFQFVGLFGEVQYGTIENVVMTASDPEHGSGYVESGYSGGLTCGTGALVGLLYVKGSDRYDGAVATVRNCTVSGYRVSYKRTAATGNIALGGLVGYSHGYIRNSSVVNKVTGLNVPSGKGKKMTIGGLVGAVGGKGRVENCYAGGGLNVTAGGMNKVSSVGGICGGNIDIPGFKLNKNAAGLANNYSYCTWTREEIAETDNLSLYGVVSNELNAVNCYYLEDSRGAGIGFKDVSGVSKKSMMEMSDISEHELQGFGKADEDNSYPWPEDKEKLSGSVFPFPAVVQSVDSEGNKQEYIHYGSWPTNGIRAVQSYFCYYEKYTDGSYGCFYLDEKGTPQRSLDDNNSKEIAETGYGMLCSPRKDFEILYQPWYDAQLSPEYKEGGETVLDKTVLEDNMGASGELNLYSFTTDFQEKHLYMNSLELSAKRVGIIYTNEFGETFRQDFYVNIRFAADISLTKGTEYGLRKAEIRTAEQLQTLENNAFGGWEFSQTHNITAADSSGFLKNNTDKCYTYDGKNNEIRGLRHPLFDINNGGIYHVKLTETVVMETGNAAALVLTALYASEIKDCAVSGNVSSANGSASGLVNVNGGTIDFCFADVNVSAAREAAGLVVNNNTGVGSNISGCIVNGMVTSTWASASGFVYSNDGMIVSSFTLADVSAPYTASGFMVFHTGGEVWNCYTNCNVRGKDAAGFVYITYGSISNCYSVGLVEATQDAAGFFRQGESKVSYCYSIAKIAGGTNQYGFGGNRISNKSNPSCYWVSTKNFNNGISDSSGAVRLTKFKLLTSDDMLKKLGSNWTLDNGAATFPETMEGNYPYPRLSVLPHYGDWPVASDSEEDNNN